MITKFINIRVFLASFLFGLFSMYVIIPEKKQIIVYPSPDNHDAIQYKDKADNCFEIKQTKTKCPEDTFKIFQIPIQAP